ncbi:head completion/stabilization protein [Carnimonas bestiolae]|uniref:head completion/stabilization protein n=1 Tax=Carnimonas bestiolae TaxID=3402172 RepID=UPI003EDC3DB2
MNDFLAIGSEKPHEKAGPIKNAPFWPDIDPEAFRSEHRITDTVTNSRVISALANAIGITNRMLREWRSKHSQYETLGDVPEYEWLPTGGLTAQYKRAVFSEAHALILDHYLNVGATGRMNEDDDSRRDMADTHRRDARWAVNEILDRPHTTVELI